MSESPRQILSRLLDWSMAMGVDTALSDEPMAWLGPDRPPPGVGFSRLQSGIAPTRPETAGGVRTGEPSPVASPRSPDVRPSPLRPRQSPAIANSASERPPVHTARNLAELARMIDAFEGCSFKATAKSTCFYRGADAAPLMIIGHAPGSEDESAGRPFVGPAGQFLDRMLAAIGMAEDNVHITNLVYWPLPAHRDPSLQESGLCRPFLERQIELVAPRVILLLGGIAASHMLATSEGILKVRGRWHEITSGGRKIPVLPSHHPTYLLSTPAAKKHAWRDLLQIRAELEGQPR